MLAQVVRGVSRRTDKIRLMEQQGLNLEGALTLLTAWELAREEAGQFSSDSNVLSMRPQQQPQQRSQFQNKPAEGARPAAKPQQPAGSGSRQSGGGGGYKAHGAGKQSANAPSAASGQPQGQAKPCHRCEGQHQPSTCKYIEAVCDFCAKQGHILPACFKLKQELRKQTAAARGETPPDGTRPKGQTASVNMFSEQPSSGLSVEQPPANTFAGEYGFFHMKAKAKPVPTALPITKHSLKLELWVDGQKILAEPDTGSGATLISMQHFQQLWPGRGYAPTTLELYYWNDHPVNVLGQINVEVKCGHSALEATLHVAEGDGSFIMGRDWLRGLGFYLGRRPCTACACPRGWSPLQPRCRWQLRRTPRPRRPRRQRSVRRRAQAP